MNYEKYLGQIEKAHTKRKLAKLLELIGNDFAGAVSVRGSVCYALHAAPVNKKGRSFTTFLHGD